MYRYTNSAIRSISQSASSTPVHVSSPSPFKIHASIPTQPSGQSMSIFLSPGQHPTYCSTRMPAKKSTYGVTSFQNGKKASDIDYVQHDFSSLYTRALRPRHRTDSYTDSGGGRGIIYCPTLSLPNEAERER